MKQVMWLLLLSMAFSVSGVQAATVGGGVYYNARTGDTHFDVLLGDLNVEANADRNGFISDLSVSYGFPRIEVENLMVKVKMPLADVYMTVRTAKLIQRPLDFVVKEYQVNKDKGWGVMAKNLGIKPGSEEFHVLKKEASVNLEKAKGRKKDKGDKGDTSKEDKPKSKGKGKKE